MSFEEQETRYSCLPASLRYALSLLGVGLQNGEEVSEDDIWNMMGIKGEKQEPGAEEEDLRKAAKKFGITTKFHSYKRLSPKQFLEDLKAATSKGHPCILTWHSEEYQDEDEEEDGNHFHWVCVAGFNDEGDKVILFDPYQLDEDLSSSKYYLVETGYAPSLMCIKRFEEWIIPEFEVERGDDYHFFAELYPSKKSAHKFVPGKITDELICEMEDDFELCEYFDEYIEDLLTIFGYPSEIKEGISAHEFLKENRDFFLQMMNDLIDEDAFGNDFVKRELFIRRELDNLLAITKCYEFKVEKGVENKTFALLASHLMWRCCDAIGRFDRYE